MRISSCWLGRQIATCLVLFLVIPFGATDIARAQQASTDQQAESGYPPQAQSPGTTPQIKPGTATNEPEVYPASTQPEHSQTPGNNQQPVSQQNTSQQEPNGTSTPVGTAAAPYEKPIGVAASRPAGAAIAPAKQKRTGSLVIKVGLLVAAGVAIGTVVALSSGSPSRPH